MLGVDIRKIQGDFTVHASFVTEETGVTALFGPSGAGKTSVINMIVGLAPPGRRYADFDQIVELLGIGRLLDRRPAKLSGGEKQRTAIGRSLLISPELLLMDEPPASLDQARKQEVPPFINALTTELSVPIVYVSHMVEEITAIASSVVILEQGGVVTTGKIGDVASYLQPTRNGAFFEPLRNNGLHATTGRPGRRSA